MVRHGSKPQSCRLIFRQGPSKCLNPPLRSQWHLGVSYGDDHRDHYSWGVSCRLASLAGLPLSPMALSNSLNRTSMLLLGDDLWFQGPRCPGLSMYALKLPWQASLRFEFIFDDKFEITQKLFWIRYFLFARATIINKEVSTAIFSPLTLRPLHWSLMSFALLSLWAWRRTCLSYSTLKSGGTLLLMIPGFDTISADIKIYVRLYRIRFGGRYKPRDKQRDLVN